MTDEEHSARPWAGRISDARGRKVTQLDPVALHLLRRHEVVPADTLQKIAEEKSIRITFGERAVLLSGVCGAVLVIAIFIIEALRDGLADAPYAKMSGALYVCSFPGIIWYGIKRKRFGNITSMMLKYVRCPHCGYDLRFLPADPTEGATVCPECGCTWQLNGPGNDAHGCPESGTTREVAGDVHAVDDLRTADHEDAS